MTAVGSFSVTKPDNPDCVFLQKCHKTLLKPSSVSASRLAKGRKKKISRKVNWTHKALHWEVTVKTNPPFRQKDKYEPVGLSTHLLWVPTSSELKSHHLIMAILKTITIASHFRFRFQLWKKITSQRQPQTARFRNPYSLLWRSNKTQPGNIRVWFCPIVVVFRISQYKYYIFQGQNHAAEYCMLPYC